jgi:2-amino-4-hydroxy-6-hydroxymethyldihydropteridine diphosphokinase
VIDTSASATDKPKHKILISTGSNIDKDKHTQAGFDQLADAFDNISVSSVFESQSVGFKGDTFYNAVVSAETDMSLSQVCEVLKTIETKNGRVRQAEKFSSRTLDLDLLCFDSMVCDKPIVLPREEILFNAFVLQPLAELVPEDIHPVVQKTYAQLWEDYDKSKQKLWISDFTWSRDP